MRRGILWLITAVAVTAASFLLYDSGKALFDPNPNFTWLDMYGDHADNYDHEYMGTSYLDWPVGIVWYGNASLDNVSSYLSSVGYPSQAFPSQYKYVRVWEDSEGGNVAWSGSDGNKTGCFWNIDPMAPASAGCVSGDGCMRHTRMYADNQYFSNAYWGNYILATTHYDTNEAFTSCVGTGPQRFGWGETNENIIAALAGLSGYTVVYDYWPMYNAGNDWTDYPNQHYHESDGYASFINFHPEPNPPASVKSEFTSTSTNRLSWATSSRATYYVVCSDFSPTGAFSSCSGHITNTYYNVSVPGTGYDGTQWYNKVMACNSLGCSALTTDYTLTERAYFSGWNYAFTYYRSSSSEKFQYINFMTYSGVGLGLKLHIKNGSSVGSTTVSTTSCLAHNTVSGTYSYSRSSFTSKLGTVGHTIGTYDTCGSDDSGDATSNRWGYRP